MIDNNTAPKSPNIKLIGYLWFNSVGEWLKLKIVNSNVVKYKINT